jgi:hypothetical protein
MYIGAGRSIDLSKIRKSVCSLFSRNWVHTALVYCEPWSEFTMPGFPCLLITSSSTCLHHLAFRLTNSPTHDLSAIYIYNGRQMHKPSCHGNVGEICVPYLICMSNLQSSKQIGLNELT